ncbi:odorant receptor 192 [Nasonia vitripennis]|uniref:Odorant receptor n=1 Tax=Nasonia vitripennis TaxID=7425 RepID=A0A7M6UGX2_NASVI|nr:odorant receptor 192 [Nasonia vitripennis]
MDILKSSYYIRCNKYLSFYGHWPYQNVIVKIRNQIVIMLLIMSIFLPQFMKMIEIRHYFHYFILSLPSLLYYTQFIAKNVFAFVGRKQIKNVLDKIQQDFQVYKGEDLAVLHEYSKKAQKFNKFYTVYMFMVVGAYSMLPFTLYMLDTFVPLNYSRLPYKPRLVKYCITTFDDNILFIIIHGGIADMMAIVFVIGFDTLFLSFAYHICALFVIVTHKIRDAVNDEIDSQNSTINECSNLREDISYRNFVKTITLHKYVLTFIDTIETAFSPLNVISIALAMVPLTITGFEVVMNKGNPGEMLRYAMYAIAEMIHLFYYNWPGQKIRDHSMLIYEACYATNWYRKDFSVRSKKIMNLMMIRSQKPSYLTAGKIYVLGLENFAAVMRVSMSYFTVLSSVT